MIEEGDGIRQEMKEQARYLMGAPFDGVIDRISYFIRKINQKKFEGYEEDLSKLEIMRKYFEE